VNPDRILKVTQEGGRLFAEPTDSPKVELFPLSDTNFIRKDQDVQYSFVPNPGGKAEVVNIRFGGRTTEARRVSDETLIPFELLTTGKIAEATEGYRKIRRERPNNVVTTEERLNSLGYSLMR